MDLINKDFEKLIHHQFLTENVSLLLYSLVRTYRPVKVLEVGAGYSSLCITKAFEDVQTETLLGYKLGEKSVEPNEQLYTKMFDKTGLTYSPRITIIDYDQKRTEKVYNILNDLNLMRFVDVLNVEAMEYLKSNQDNYDMIWIDFSSGLEYREILQHCFKMLDANGIIAFHNTATNVAGRLFLSELNMKSKISDDFEFLTIHEPHKKIQNSITLVKKKGDYPMHYALAR